MILEAKTDWRVSEGQHESRLLTMALPTQKYQKLVENLGLVKFVKDLGDVKDLEYRSRTPGVVTRSEGNLLVEAFFSKELLSTQEKTLV